MKNRFLFVFGLLLAIYAFSSPVGYVSDVEDTVFSTFEAPEDLVFTISNEAEKVKVGDWLPLALDLDLTLVGSLRAKSFVGIGYPEAAPIANKGPPNRKIVKDKTHKIQIRKPLL